MSLKDIVNNKLTKQISNRIYKNLKDLPQPSELKNCVRAAKRIIENLNNGKRLLVVGDYDTDGIVATTILIEFLIDAGYGPLIDYIIPSRLKDGYGVSTNIINYADDNLFDFIVSVDNGIAAIEAINLANEKDLEVIITDHHTAPEILPNVDIIVNPRVPGETFPYPWISGATVAWYLVAALKNELNMSNLNVRKYLDLVAITIVSDVMPLNDINLVLLSTGLAEIKKRNRLIYRLVWNDWTAPLINETALGFNFVPMINAIGRINDANIGVKMFLSKSESEIKNYYKKMVKINEDRKIMSRENLKEAESLLNLEYDLTKPVIVVRNKNFHEGIVGIIAGKLAEKFKRPAYVFSYSEDKLVWKGSARTYGQIHLYDLTNTASRFILGFGGHKGAVGLSVSDENFELFENKLVESGYLIPKEDFINETLVPIEAVVEDMDIELLDLIDKFQPFGQSNPMPTFKMKCYINITREMKGGLHFAGDIESLDRKTRIPGVFFNVDREDFLNSVNLGRDIITIEANISRAYDAKLDIFYIQLLSKIVD